MEVCALQQSILPHGSSVARKQMRKSKAVDKKPFKRAAPVTDFLLRFPSFWLLAVLSDLCFAHATPYSLLLFSFSLSSVLLHSPFLSPFLTVSGHETRADLKLTSNSQSSFSVFYFPGWEVPNSILALASPGPHALTGWVPPSLLAALDAGPSPGIHTLSSLSPAVLGSPVHVCSLPLLTALLPLLPANVLACFCSPHAGDWPQDLARHFTKPQL